MLELRRLIIMTRKTRSKLTTKGEGLMSSARYTNDAYKIVVRERLLLGLINDKFLKHYFL